MPEAIKLKEALANCDEQNTLKTVESMLDAGMPPVEIVAICNEGMSLLGERFDQGEAFLPDLMFGGMIMKRAMARLEPLLGAAAENPARRTIVLGTVQHDVHDIGKDIAAMVFRSNGFHVVDLGVNVAPERFVEAIREHRPELLGMSLLLTTCYKSVTETMEAIRTAGIRDSVRICVGGAAASALMAERAGLDFYAKTAIDGLNWAKKTC